MRMRVLSTVKYQYEETVDRAHFQCRLKPAAMQRQVVLSHPLSCEPSGWQLSYDDYWGTRVVDVEISEPHDGFTVSLMSDVNQVDAPPKPLAADFERLEAVGVEDFFWEFLRPTERTRVEPELREQARAARAGSVDPKALVESLAAEMEPGARADDRTHALIGMLRGAGLPARFVTGYRVPLADFDPGQSKAGEFASWVDYWDGAWHGFDPELGTATGDQHVIVGWGRDRSDCPPLRGIYRGAEEATCTREVSFTRLA